MARKNGATAAAAAAIDAVFPLILALRQRRPAPGQPKRLDGLFRDLGQIKPSRDPDEIEELIWAIWIGHDDARAAADMAAAAEAMAAGALDLAEAVCARLAGQYPQWPEPWNKLATLAFLARRDAEALTDIGKVLALEPRHFGAVAGFGQICLRQQRPREASAAFQMALAINPHLQGVAEIVREIAAIEGPMH